MTHSDATKQGLARCHLECAGACHSSIDCRDAKTRPKTFIHHASTSRDLEPCPDRVTSGLVPKIKQKMGQRSRASNASTGTEREEGKKREKQRTTRSRGEWGRSRSESEQLDQRWAGCAIDLADEMRSGWPIRKMHACLSGFKSSPKREKRETYRWQVIPCKRRIHCARPSGKSRSHGSFRFSFAQQPRQYPNKKIKKESDL